jgi:hypothetical protein
VRRPGPTRRLSGALHQKGNGLERFWNTHICPPRLLGERGSSKTSKPDFFSAVVTMSRRAIGGEESVRSAPVSHAAAAAAPTSNGRGRGRLLREGFCPVPWARPHTSSSTSFPTFSCCRFSARPQRPPSFSLRATAVSERLARPLLDCSHRPFLGLLKVKHMAGLAGPRNRLRP